MSSMDGHVPDATFVKAVADLVHPDSGVQTLYRQKALVVGSDVTIFDDPMLPEPTPMHVSTLSAVVAYVKAGMADYPVAINVTSPTEVRVVAPLAGDQRQQFTYLIARPVLPEIYFERYLDMESFMIQLQSCFVQTNTRDLLQAFCSKTKAGLAREIEDDGVSQTVTVLNGVTRTEDLQVNNPWALSPYRTFPEIEQPETAYLLRMRGKPCGDNVAATAELREADGGAWRCVAIHRIGAYLREQLGEDVTILA